MFSSIISKVWEELSTETIRNGFRKAGICPFCDTILSNEIFEPAALKRFQVFLDQNASLSGPAVPQKIFSNPGCSEDITNHSSTLDTVTTVHTDDNSLDNGQEQVGASVREEYSFEAILLRHVKNKLRQLVTRNGKKCSGV